MLNSTVTLKRFYRDLTPVFHPLSCVLCAQAIHGCMFECIVGNCKDQGSQGYICQDCQHEGKHPDHHLTKHYKHCILPETIDPTMSRKICKCSTVSRYDDEGRTRSLFPIRKTDKHRVSPKGAVQCGLLDLGDLIAEAKYAGMLLKKTDKGWTLDEEKRAAHERAQRLESETLANRPRAQIATETIDEKEAKEDIPFFIRKITDRYPFGNVHMALRLGRSLSRMA
jgi:hypothetical protein